MKKLIAIFISVLISSLVFAESEPAFSEEVNKSEIIGQDLPVFARSLFGNARINLQITLNDGSMFVYGLVTQNGVVTSLVSEELSNPSLNVYTSEIVAKRLIESDNFFNDLESALSNGDITYKAVGLVNKIRFGFISLMLKLFNKNKESSLVTASVVAEEPSVIDDNKIEPIAEAEDSEEVKQHLVELTVDGFRPEVLRVKLGDKVTWKNERFTKAMIIGLRKCREVKSEIFEQGESYEYTFTEKGRCDIVDGIMTTKSSVVYVE